MKHQVLSEEKMKIWENAKIFVASKCHLWLKTYKNDVKMWRILYD